MYSEHSIGRALARQTFRGCLCVVDKCQWPGSECDLLVVTDNLRVIDVEIKISRADLKADRTKDKWLGRQPYPDFIARKARPMLDWPRRVWKHYYAIAKPIWDDALLEHCGAASGVLLVDLERRFPLIDVKRRAKPNRDNVALSAAEAVDVARLASLRMWDAYALLENSREQTA